MEPTHPTIAVAHRPSVAEVYDPVHRKLLVQYPVWLIVVLSVLGAAAFALVGFFDYPEDPPLYSAAARDGWPLFLWFCLLLFLLDITILRQPKRRAQLFAILSMSVFTVMAVTVLFYDPRLLLGPFADSYQAILPAALALVNVVLLAGFLLGAVRRISRRWRGLPLSTSVHIEIDEGVETAPPTVLEALAGDLLTVAAVTAILQVIYSPTVLGTISLPILKVAVRRCNVPFTAINVTTWDSAVALACGMLGSVLLVVVVLRGGLPAALRTVRYALSRRARILVSNLLLSVRSIAWLLCVVIAIPSASLAAHYTELYLHLQGSPQSGAAGNLLLTAVLYLALAWATGALSFISCTCAAALLLFSSQVLREVLNVLPLLIRYGQMLLLALAAFNGLLWATGITSRTPFFQPSAGTIASIVGFAVLVFFPRFRRSD